MWGSYASVAADDGDWAPCMGGAVNADRAEHHPGKSAVLLVSHHEHVGVLRLVDQGLCRMSVDNPALDRYGRLGTADSRDLLVEYLVPGLLDLVSYRMRRDTNR